jgi:hypothetical protein
MKSKILLIAVIVLGSVTYSKAQDYPVRNDTINSKVRNDTHIYKSKTDIHMQKSKVDSPPRSNVRTSTTNKTRTITPAKTSTSKNTYYKRETRARAASTTPRRRTHINNTTINNSSMENDSLKIHRQHIKTQKNIKNY